MAKVIDYMDTTIDMIEPRRPALEAARQMVERDVDALIVCDNGRLLGMVTHADIVRAVAGDGDLAAASVAEIMLPEVLFCFADQSVEEAATRMHGSLVRRLPVLSREKALLGVITLDELSDLAVHHRQPPFAHEPASAA